jgi:DNA-binding NarL/FixJ family response regulator
MANAPCILIVDDQRRTRQSLKALLASHFQSIRLLEAAGGVEAIRQVEEHRPNLIIMDARMPGTDGIEATRLIKAQSSQVRVIVLTLFDEYRAAALTAGADAFVNKGEPPARLLAAVAAALNLPHL